MKTAWLVIKDVTALALFLGVMYAAMVIGTAVGLS